MHRIPSQTGRSYSPQYATVGQETRSPTVNLEAWNRAALGAKQLDSVSRLSEWVKRREAERVGMAGVADERQQEKQSDEENQAGPSGTSAPPVASSSLALPSAPITSSSDLLPWLESVKSSSTAAASSSTTTHPSSSSLEAYRSSLAQIQTSTTQITTLLDELEQARINVAELKAGAKLVEETSEELRDESERRGGGGSHQSSLLSLVSSLETYLGYYSLLPQATAFLSSPNLSLVLTPTFSHTMSQLDVGLSFILAHPHFVDASLYRLRFEHCLMRGGNLVKLWVCNKLRDLKADALDRIKSRGKGVAEEGESVHDLQDFASPELLRILYSRFVASAPELQSVLIEVQQHCPEVTGDDGTATPSVKAPPQDEESLLADYSADGPPATPPNEQKTNTFPEFATILTDCRNAYFDARRAVIVPTLSTVLTKIENKAQAEASASAVSSSPLHLFARHALVLVKSICISEATLYQSVFGKIVAGTNGGTSSRSALVDFLKILSKDLLDRLHPRIFAESRLSALSALAAIILDAANTKETSQDTRRPVSETDGYLLLSLDDPHYPEARPYFIADPLNHAVCILQPLITPLMEDVLNRTTFRARAIINGPDVAGFAPRVSSEASSDDPTEILKRVMSKAVDRGGRKGLRGRSSLGVGVLEAAAQRAVSDSNTQSTTQPQDEEDTDAEIQLFSLPSQETLQTWYTPLVRLFKILSLLHPICTRSTFGQIGTESVEKTRGVIKRASEALRVAVESKKNANELDALDIHLFALHHTLLLREVSASVDLSLMQLSTWDKVSHSIKASYSSADPSGTSTAGGLLDVGAIFRIVTGLLDGMGLASSNSSETHTPISSDLQLLTNALVDSFVEAKLPKYDTAGETTQTAYVEECVVQIRLFRRRVATWLKDEEIVQAIVTGVVAAVGTVRGVEEVDERVEDMQAEILDRLGGSVG